MDAPKWKKINTQKTNDSNPYIIQIRDQLASTEETVKLALDVAQRMAISYTSTALSNNILDIIESAGEIDDINRAFDLIGRIKQYCIDSKEYAKKISNEERDKVIDKMLASYPEDIQIAVKERTRD